MQNGNHAKEVKTFSVVVCAFNEARRIEAVIRAALDQHPHEVIVIDDASTDGTAEVAEQAGARVSRNARNMGKGACLRRGFELARMTGVDAIIVVDGDGQHDPAEIPRFLDAYERTKIPILIGNRMAHAGGMPLIRRWTNRVMAWILNRLAKIYVADPPCGYRFSGGQCSGLRALVADPFHGLDGLLKLDLESGFRVSSLITFRQHWKSPEESVVQTCD